MTGEIPPELGGLSNLTWLYLYENQLTGEIPPELGGLSNLTYLTLSENQLTGEIRLSWAACPTCNGCCSVTTGLPDVSAEIAGRT